MRKVLLLSVVMLLGASMAFAQGGSFGIFADPAGTNCNLADAVAGLCSYYVVHVNAPGVTAGEFAAPKPACHLGVFLSDTAVFPVTLGNSQTGVSIGYGACRATPLHILTINFFCQGLTGPCCLWSILPHPATGADTPEMVDCVNALWPATGGQAIINANASCQCNVPVEESTWGQVKSLYSE